MGGCRPGQYSTGPNSTGPKGERRDGNDTMRSHMSAVSAPKLNQKRSTAITLVLLGSVATYGASRQGRCSSDDPNQRGECRSSGGGSSGYSGGARSGQDAQ